MGKFSKIHCAKSPFKLPEGSSILGWEKTASGWKRMSKMSDAEKKKSKNIQEEWDNKRHKNKQKFGGGFK